MLNQYKIFVDMDGVLCEYLDTVLKVMNSKAHMVANDPEFYKIKYNKFFKACKKAVSEQGGELDKGNLGELFLAHHVSYGTPRKQVRKFMYSCVFNDYNFWLNLPWTKDGKMLWNYVEKYNPYILSSPQGPNSITGKYNWVKREISLSDEKIIITKNKYEHAVKTINDGYVPILIDDLEKHVKPFRENGGIAIQHTSTSETIKSLQTIGL